MDRPRSFLSSHRRKSSVGVHHPPPVVSLASSAAASSQSPVGTGAAPATDSSYYASDDEAEHDLAIGGGLTSGGSIDQQLHLTSSFQGAATDHDADKVHTKRSCWFGCRRLLWGTMMRTRRTFSLSACCGCGIRWAVLIVLCLQNSLFTVLRRYSQGVLRESYSKYECLLLGEIIKIVFSAWMIRSQLLESAAGAESSSAGGSGSAAAASGDSPSKRSPGNRDEHNFRQRLLYLLQTSRKMLVLAGMYGAMNILSFVALRNISAGLFTIIAQAKIVTTAVFSSLLLQRRYTSTQWRALIALVLGVLLFSEPVWNKKSVDAQPPDPNDLQRPWLGTAAVLIEVTMSGFASIYFEKVIKMDPLQLSIWERNFQLALGSVPVYVLFILQENARASAGIGSGWTPLAFVVAALGAAGGLLVALSIKYGDSILKTLATTGAIVLSSILDHWWLHGPLTPPMVLAGCQVIVAICNYTFDTTPATGAAATSAAPVDSDSKKKPSEGGNLHDEEMASLLQPSASAELTKMKRQASRDSIHDG
jgi:solute carrier family 35 (UDP-sugar transporter), member A1/2/3